MSTRTPANPHIDAGTHAFDRLYAQSIDENDDAFNRRNGVFYPTGYALYALPPDGVERAIQALQQAGHADQELTLLKPEQMRQLVDCSEAKAGLAARIVGAELKQLEVLEQLADEGDHFVLIKADDDGAKEQLQHFGNEVGARKGLLFHTLAVEELPVPKETIPGRSPFAPGEVVHAQDSDARTTDRAGNGTASRDEGRTRH